jgi:hypothetical protein
MILLVFGGDGRNGLLKTLGIEEESLNRAVVGRAPERHASQEREEFE